MKSNNIDNGNYAKTADVFSYPFQNFQYKTPFTLTALILYFLLNDNDILSHNIATPNAASIRIIK